MGSCSAQTLQVSQKKAKEPKIGSKTQSNPSRADARTLQAIAIKLEAMTSNKNATNIARCIATRSKNATRGSWPYY